MKINKSKCAWCNEKLKVKGFKYYLGREIVHGGFGYFCDNICIECYLFNKKIHDINLNGGVNIMDIKKYNYYDKTRKCKYCSVERENKEFICQLVIKDTCTSKIVRNCWCNKECFQRYFQEGLLDLEDLMTPIKKSFKY